MCTRPPASSAWGSAAMRQDLCPQRRRFFVVAVLIAGCFAIGLPESAQASSSVTYVQGSAFATGSRVSSTTVRLAAPVNGGDLLVGWFAQYNTAGQVQVSDNVNGAWTRAPASTAFQNGTGDIALYYIQNAKGCLGRHHHYCDRGRSGILPGCSRRTLGCRHRRATGPDSVQPRRRDRGRHRAHTFGGCWRSGLLRAGDWRQPRLGGPWHEPRCCLCRQSLNQLWVRL